MKFTDIFTTSLLNLKRQKLRVFLAAFAVFVGALLITLMVSLGNGLSHFIEAQVTSLSTPTSIAVNPGEFGSGLSGAFGFGGSPTALEEETDKEQTKEEESFDFTKEDIDQIENITYVEEVIPLRTFNTDYIQLKGDNQKYQGFVTYLPPARTEGLGLVAGRKIDSTDEGKIVVTAQFAESWGFEDNLEELLGMTVKVHATQAATGNLFLSRGSNQLGEGLEPEEKDFEFEIVGITEKSLASTIVIIPEKDSIEISDFTKNLTDEDDPLTGVLELVVVVDDIENVPLVDERLEDLGYRSTTHDELLAQLGTIFDIIKLVLSAFGGIALVVAALGIMNTMLMAIYERTREIGIMKAVGATKRDIQLLFTVEATLIGFIGGASGLVIATLLGQAANTYLHQDFLIDYPTLNISIVDLQLVLLVLITTTVIALISGLYPAVRASNLDPIDALRKE